MSSVEGQWLHDKGVYTRPLLGSEATHYQISQFTEGANEFCMGVSFESTFVEDTLATKICDALCHLRFFSPLIAAEIRSQQDSHAWFYTPAPDSLHVRNWARDSLTVHRDDISDDDFILSKNEIHLPEVDKSDLVCKQYFACHLLLRSTGLHSIFIHATHFLADGFTVLNMLYTIFHHFTASKSARTIEDQHWGLEWKYLPVGPVTASGGLQDNWEIEVPLLHEAMKNIVSTHQEFSRNITAERMQIQQHGHPLRIKRVIDADTSSKLLAALKQASSSVSFLLDAAQVLAIFKQESVQATLTQDTNVLLDFSIISLDKFYVPPFNTRTHVASAMCFVPNVIGTKDIPWDKSLREQVLNIMVNLKRQYRRWLSSKHLPHLAAQTVIQDSLLTSLATNLGVVERYLPLVWPAESEQPIAVIEELILGHRQSHSYRPFIHCWSLRSKVYIQIVASDGYDENSLEKFMDDMVAIATSIIED